ncbi:MAG TPA: sulfotransferase [Rubrobacteraceae bacterium]|nr:sulfotransferase [Rubrobacteraceae bacterium]
MMEKIISKVTFDGRFEDREHVVRRFVRHTEQVKERVPPEKLLVYEVGEGWQPLCDFLGAEVPRGKPFPRLNDRQAFPKMMRRHMVAALAPRAVRAIATVSVLLAAAWALRSAVRSPRRRAG